MQFKVKFCGFTNPGDLIYAHGLGIKRAGVIFAPRSKRHNEINFSTRNWLRAVKEEAPHLDLVAVVAGISLSELETLIEWELFSYFQFNWDLASLKTFFSKQLNVSPGQINGAKIKGIWLSLSFDNLSGFMHQAEFWKEKGVEGIVLDSLDKGYYGGTGNTIAISPDKIKLLFSLRNQAFISEVSLAGGLNPLNLENILASWSSQWQDFLKASPSSRDSNTKIPSLMFPFTGIDLAGGIEKGNFTGKPVKDPELMRHFMQIVKKIEKKY